MKNHPRYGVMLGTSGGTTAVLALDVEARKGRRQHVTGSNGSLSDVRLKSLTRTALGFNDGSEELNR